MAEPIEMWFGLRTLVGPRNVLLDGVQILPREGAILRGEEASDCKVQGDSAAICAKTAETIEMAFVFWTRVGPRKHVLDGAQIPNAKGQLLGERTCPGMPDNTVVSCAKMAELIDLSFGLWTLVGRRKQKLNRIRQVAPTCPRGNRPSAAAMRPFVKLH